MQIESSAPLRPNFPRKVFTFLSHPYTLIAQLALPVALLTYAFIDPSPSGNDPATWVTSISMIAGLGATLRFVLTNPEVRRQSPPDWVPPPELLIHTEYPERFAAPCCFSRWAARGLVVCSLLSVGSGFASRDDSYAWLGLVAAVEIVKLGGAVLYVYVMRVVYAKASLFVKGIKTRTWTSPAAFVKEYNELTELSFVWGSRFGFDLFFYSGVPYLTRLVYASVRLIAHKDYDAHSMDMVVSLTQCMILGMTLARINRRSNDIAPTYARVAPSEEELKTVNTFLEMNPFRVSVFGFVVSYGLLVKVALALVNVAFPFLEVGKIRDGFFDAFKQAS